MDVAAANLTEQSARQTHAQTTATEASQLLQVTCPLSNLTTVSVDDKLPAYPPARCTRMNPPIVVDLFVSFLSG